MDELEMYKRLVAALQKENEKLETDLKEADILRQNAVRTFEKERGMHTRKYEGIIGDWAAKYEAVATELNGINKRHDSKVRYLKNQLNAARAYSSPRENHT
jgi:hypothetical protein